MEMMNTDRDLNENHTNAVINANRNRFDDLMNTITEARKSLQNWQDQKTEALIKLDALSYDIRMIGEEKEKAKESVVSIQKEMENEIRVYQNHIENLNDQLQSLQIERENLRTDLNAALIENQVNLKELARLTASENHLKNELKEGIARMQAETEVRLKAQYENEYNSQIEELKEEIESLTARNQALCEERASAEERANRTERELSGIRSHMLSVLRVADEGASSPASEARRNQNRLGENNTIASNEPKIDLKKLKAVEFETNGSVDEYLKRLGY